MKKPLSPEAARLRMADLCARSEQCEYDIRTKLTRLGIGGESADSIIDFLRRERFIDDLRFARSFARDKCRFSSWGNAKIRLGLLAKRLPRPAIEEGLEGIERKDYLDALRRVTLAKARQLDFSTETAADSRLKLYRHILSRGFESALASKAVQSYINRLHRENDSE